MCDNTASRLKKHPKISILMPIYNAESYLKLALQSVLNQTLTDIEIICINDGSTDNSLNIIKQHTSQDNRIIIIDKPNSGYGDSMNQGLMKARGEYIAILEPDDWYEPDMLQTLFDKASEYRLDVVKCDFYQYNDRPKRSKPYHLFNDNQCNKVLKPNNIHFIYSLQPSIWSAIYRRQFLNDHYIRFLDTPGASYQDTSFNFKVFTLADQVMFINRPLIHYRIDNNQSSINNIAKKLPFIDKEYDEIDKFINENQLDNEFQYIANTCRFLTYLWAMEQLNGKVLKDYIHHIKTNLSKTHPDEYRGLLDDKKVALQRITHSPNFFYIYKQLRITIHKFKVFMEKSSYVK